MTKLSQPQWLTWLMHSALAAILESASRDAPCREYCNSWYLGSAAYGSVSSRTFCQGRSITWHSDGADWRLCLPQSLFDILRNGNKSKGTGTSTEVQNTMRDEVLGRNTFRDFISPCVLDSQKWARSKITPKLCLNRKYILLREIYAPLQPTSPPSCPDSILAD